jgi:hypothetical protein
MITQGWTHHAQAGPHPSRALLRALREACVTMAAALATLACTQWIAPGIGSAVLSVVLCVSLSRSQLDRDRRGRLEAAIALPVVGLAATGVGLLLQRWPWIGAGVFVAGLSVPIWLRRFGPMARRAGSLVALPFVVLLVTPHVAPAANSRLPALLVPVLVALLALAWVAAFHALAFATAFLPRAQPPAEPPHAMERAAGDGGLRPVASTRMAIQMAVGLAAAFLVGYLGFAERWSWIVLTAFIVASGNRGRLDVLWKSGLRVLGAAAGTLLALLLSRHPAMHGAETAAWVLAAVFLGVWLRPFGYAWWALFVTIALALLQGFGAGPPQGILWLRLEEIAIGALLGVAAAWWVLPVRSTGVLRRRIADALAALSDALDPEQATRTPEGVVAAFDAASAMASPFRAARCLTRRFRPVQLAGWLDGLEACRAPALALLRAGKAPVDVRRAVGAARKAMREPDRILPALASLRAVLEAAAPERSAPLQPQQPAPVQDGRAPIRS